MTHVRHALNAVITYRQIQCVANAPVCMPALRGWARHDSEASLAATTRLNVSNFIHK